MRRKAGIGCIVLGVACLLACLGLILNNRMEAESASASSARILQNVQTAIRQNAAEYNEETKDGSLQSTNPIETGFEDCIGILSIPVLELELPVLSDWSYEQLKNAPCRYFGSVGEEDFVIAAHNYPSQFGRLNQLREKDLILFTDLSGKIYGYEVVLLETLQEEATEEMITSGFDLSLYTCTTGGGSRVTVRCRKIQ